MDLLGTLENVYNFYQVVFRANHVSLKKLILNRAMLNGINGTEGKDQFVIAHTCAIEFQRVGDDKNADKYFIIAYEADNTKFTADDFMELARYFLIKPVDKLANILTADEFTQRVECARWYLEKAAELDNEEASEIIGQIDNYLNAKDNIENSNLVFSVEQNALGFVNEVNALVQLAENISALHDVGVQAKSDSITQAAEKLSESTKLFLEKTPGERRETAGKFRYDMMAELTAIAPELEKAKAIPIVKNILFACVLLVVGYVIAALVNRYSSVGDGRWGFFAKTNSELKTNDFEAAFNAGYQDNNLVMI